MPGKTNPLNIVQNESLRRPEWLRVKFGSGRTFTDVRHLINNKNLHTVCESARCPNLGECWSRGTATFMLLGNVCTRSCTFCNIKVGKPDHYDLDEPKRIADAVKKMTIKHAVLTMVARDDLKDGGAHIVAETIKEIKKIQPDCSVEALISDLKGSRESLEIILVSQPDILNHNLETVKRLQKALRVQARYERSLQVLKWAKEAGAVIKSGIMVGVGETFEEIVEVMTDLREISCEILTIGQYLPPTKAHYPLHRYYHPDEFDDLRELGFEMGFTHVESGPLVRSSYHAEEAIPIKSQITNNK
ncbi:MAG: lipoyl synthase [Calditrichia bacterium]|nr:lipoyl synthase [Calditrichia bacterium]